LTEIFGELSLRIMELSHTASRFVLHWGEMGTRWGVNRTVAQIHALLFYVGRPMHAEEITDTLGVARSNVSTSIRELQGWKLIKLIHLPGDRRGSGRASGRPSHQQGADRGQAESQGDA
jgi:DNA-binding transcriptional regulator GbsR (MarR family)